MEIPVVHNINIVPIIKRSFKTVTVLFVYPEWYGDQNTLQGCGSPVFLRSMEDSPRYGTFYAGIYL